jgi:hypothetical protein
MRVNFCANRYIEIYGGWYNAYKSVMDCFNELGFEVRLSPGLRMEEIPEYAKVGIEDSPDDIYVYNHTYKEDLEADGFYLGLKTFIIKNTLPSPNHFTLDSLGYAASSSITYKKPQYKNYDSKNFFKNTVPRLVDERQNKWSDREWCEFTSSKEDLMLPDNHILILGQLPMDETCRAMSFGHNFIKICNIVSSLESLEDSIVVKLHPHLMSGDPELSGEETDWIDYEILQNRIDLWRSKGITVLTGYESLYDVLPHTRVGIVENSTSGFETLMFEVPLISYGLPEYHWVTKDLRHVHKIKEYVTDLSWYNKKDANSFTAWYFEKYLCHNKETAMTRVLEILAE